MDETDDTLIAEDGPGRTETDKPMLRGESVGRYVVLDKLGEGGMGVVYTAFDPQLDRKLALKVLHDSGKPVSELSQATDGSPRLLREAQALAKLNHPNVVTIHDVGILERGTVFLAMEFIDGQTLRDWCETPRPWREVLAMFVEVGRGLAAAHRVGIVHRDFKPDNVMIGPDGRPRVLDFGLARAAEAELHDGAKRVRAEPSHDIPLTVSNTLDAKLTITGAVMGTPAYMAPEQHLGQTVDERTDQFSFCVAIYEAVYGERPFAGDSAPALAFAVCQGKIREAPKSTAVPAWLRKVLVRGLALEPGDRYPSMDALLRELGRDPVRGRRRVALGVGAVAVVAALAIAGQASLSEPKICAGADAHLAGVWDPATKASVAEAFAATEVEFAEDAHAQIVARLDAYAAGWVEMHEDACAATRIRGEQSDELLTLRMACLERSLVELRSLAAVYADVTPETLAQAIEAADALPPLRLCADLEGLRHEVRPPQTEALREEVEAIREPLAEARARFSAGQSARSCELAEPLIARADATEYRPLIAEVQLAYGRCAEDGEAKVAAIERAVWMAEASRHERVATEAWIALVHARAHGTSEFDAALDAVRWAGAAIERLGADPYLETELDAAKGYALLLAGRYREAIEVLERAHAARVSGDETSQKRAIYELVTLCNALMSAGETDEARRLLDEYVPRAREQLGPRHPWVARLLSTQARILYTDGKLDAAEQALREARARFAGIYGPTSQNVGAIDNSLGLVLDQAGHHEEALASYQRALATFRANVGDRHVATIQVLHNIGNLERFLGRHEASLEHLLESYTLLGEVYEAGSPEFGFHAFDIASTLRALGRHEEAIARYDEALAIFAARGEDYEPNEVYVLTGRAMALDGLGRTAEARADFEAAEAIVARRDDVGNTSRGRLGFEFGAFLWRTGSERERARELVLRGRGDFEKELPGSHTRADIEAIDAWLAEHPA